MTSKSFNPLPYSDFRSDTATAPTPDMFAAMMKASLGDDVYSEDDSVKKLEEYVATLCGHEAALFCSSGTMTNQLAHRVHLCNPPQSVIVDIRSHVFNYEAGGISFHSQAAVYPIMPANGKYLTVEDIASRLVLDVDVHYAPTRVISLENTLNGTIMPIEDIVRLRELTKKYGIKLHLDGARLWHANIATGISMKEYCSHFDTVSLCLSKGIGAPIGSILVGSELAIKKARHFRLLFGGGWRQAGILAEAALWGIKRNWPTMEVTHRRAKWLERAFLELGCRITNPVDTNMVWVDTSDAGFTVEELMTELAKENIKISGSGCAARVVLHYQITDEAVRRFIEILRQLTCMPKMMVNVDLVEAAMLEKQGNIYDDSTNSFTSATSDTPATPITPITPSTPLVTAESNAEFPKVNYYDRRHSDLGILNIKRCLLEGNQELSAEATNTVQPYSRKAFNDLANKDHQSTHAKDLETEQQCALEEKTHYQSKVTMKGDDEEEEEELLNLQFVVQQRQRDASLTSVVPRSKSLDLQELESRSTSGALVLELPHSADKKKMLGYRVSHNTASKAIKRASNRIARWSGSLLTREA
ncbi:pyridoxal phosphate-dependent transferase [Dissophora ornata]|nr:Threonine aldolase [Dissophora ornata]KAI8596733.1 pyridoxal phosphate-dependent transferase [Dissophora ornata]